jgi:hypothetical protein
VGEPLGAPGSPLRVSGQPNANSIVDLETPIVLTFSEAIDTSTVNSTNVVVSDAAGLRVFGAFAASTDGLRVTFVPTRRWRFATSFSYTVSTRVRAASGARLDKPVTGRFSTFAPRVIATADVGDVRDVAVDGSLAVVGGATHLSVLNVGDPGNPAVVNRADVAEGVGGVALRPAASFIDRNGQTFTGTLGLATVGSAASKGELRVLNLATPTAPLLIGATQLTVPTGTPAPANVPNAPGVPRSVLVDTAYRALVAVEGVGVESVDVTKAVPTDVASPGSALGPRYPPSALGSAVDVALAGSRTLIVGTGGLTVLDSATLTLLGGITITGTPTAVASLQSYLFDVNGNGALDAATETVDLALVATSEPGTLQFFNVTDPAVPTLVGVVRFPQGITSVAVNPAERLAYVGGGFSGVSIVDLAGPASIQPIDIDSNQIDDRILGTVNTNGEAGPLALALSQGIAFVADGPAGLGVIQLSPPRTRFTELLRDPVKAATGDEQSILETREAYVSDDALRVLLTASIPPQSSLFLVIEEVATGGGRLLSFADGTTTRRLTNGLNEIEILVAKPSTTTVSAVTLRIHDGAARSLESVVVQLITPNLTELELQDLFSVPESLTITQPTQTIQLSIGGRFADGVVRNLTHSSAGTEYSTDRAIAGVTVDGVVTGVAGGTTKVFASKGDKQSATDVKIQLAPKLLSLEVVPRFLTITSLTQRPQLEVVGHYTDETSNRLTSDQATTYLVSNPALATITNGRIVPTATGTTTITVQHQDQSATASVHIVERTTPNLESIVLAIPPQLVAPVTAIPVLATIDGTGSLDGVPVTFTLEGFGVPNSIVGLSDISGRAQASLAAPLSPGTGTLRSTVTDPTDGSSLIATIPITVHPPASDPDASSTPQEPSHASSDASLDGSVGSQDALDVYDVLVTERGTLLFTFAVTTGPEDSLRARLLNASLQEIDATSSPADGRPVTVVPGRYRLEIRSAAGSVQYRASWLFNQATPVITSVHPTSATPGTQVAIQGSGFSVDAARNMLMFGGVMAAVTFASDTELRAIVPAEASDGPLALVVGERRVIGPQITVGRAVGPTAFAAPPDASTMAADPQTGLLTSYRRLLIGVAPNVSRAQVDALVATVGGRVIGYLPLDSTYQVEFSSTNLYDLSTRRRQLVSNALVQSAESETAIDFNTGTSRDGARLSNCAPSCAWASEITRLLDAYNYIDAWRLASGRNLAPVRIAIIDSGLDLTHKPFADEFEYLQSQQLTFLDATIAGSTPTTARNSFHDAVVGDESVPHGSLVTATLAAGNNGKGTSGVLGGLLRPGESGPFSFVIVGLLPAGLEGPGDLATNAIAYAAIDRLMANGGADVVNMSWGHPDATQATINSFGRRIRANPNVLFVASAGQRNRNLDSSAQAPGGLNRYAGVLPNLVTVTGTGAAREFVANAKRGSQTLTVTNFADARGRFRDKDGDANFATVNMQPSDPIDLAAPGIVYVAGRKSGAASQVTGTSFAAPIVTGVASMLLSVVGIAPTHSELRGATCESTREAMLRCVKRILRETSDKIDESWRGHPDLTNTVGGMIRVNALAAVSRALPRGVDVQVVVADASAETVQRLKLHPFGRNIPDDDSVPGASIGGIARPNSVAYSRDGLRTYIATDSALYVLSTEAVVAAPNSQTLAVNAFGKSIPLPKGLHATALAVSADDQFVFVGAGLRLLVFDVEQRVFVESIRGYSPSDEYVRPVDISKKLELFGPTVDPVLLAMARAIKDTCVINQLPPCVRIVRLHVTPDGRELHVVVDTGDGAGVQPGGILVLNISTPDALPLTTGTQPDVRSFLNPLRFLGVTPRQVAPGLMSRGGDRPRAAITDPTTGDVYVVHGGIGKFSGRTEPPNQVMLAVVAVAVSIMGPAFHNLTLFNAIADNIVASLTEGYTQIDSIGLIGRFDRLSDNQIPDPLPVPPSPFSSALEVGWVGTVREPVLPTHPTYAKRPFDIAFRPDGQRALMPFFQSGNFGVLDKVAQSNFVVATQSGGPFRGVVAVTPSIDLDRYAAPVDDEATAKWFPTEVRYSQTGSFAVAVHSGSHIYESGIGHQRGSISVVLDDEITKDLREHADEETNNLPYYLLAPLPAETVRSITRVGSVLLEKPVGVAVQPALAVVSPRSGDVVLDTTSIVVQWQRTNTPTSPQRTIQSLDVRLEWLNDTGQVVRTWSMPAPRTLSAFESSVAIPIRQLLGEDAATLTPGNRTVRVTVTGQTGARLSDDRFEQVAESLLIVLHKENRN